MESIKHYKIIIVFSLIIYILTVIGSVGNFFYPDMWNLRNTVQLGSHQVSSYQTMLSMLDGKMSLDPNYAFFATPDVGYYNGNFYSFFPPGLAIVALPFFMVGSLLNIGLLSALFGIALFGIATSILLYKISREIFSMSGNYALLTTLLFSGITYSLTYNVIFMQHTIAAFFITLLLYLIWRYRHHGDPKHIYPVSIGVWSIYGLSFFFDYPNAFILLPLMFYFFLVVKEKKKKTPTIWKTFIGSSIIMVFAIATVHLSYNFLVYGNAGEFSNTLPFYSGSNLHEVTTKTDELAAVKPFYDGLSLENIPYGLHVLLFEKYKSMFLFVPVLLLGLSMISGKYLYNQKMEHGILWLIIGITILLYASFHSPSGGWAFASRYMIPVLVPLSIFTIEWLRNKRHVVWHILFTILGLYTLATTLSGTLGIAQNRPFEQTLYLGIKNFRDIMTNESRNFIYNHFLSGTPLLNYYLIIFVIIATVFIYSTHAAYTKKS